MGSKTTLYLTVSLRILVIALVPMLYLTQCSRGKNAVVSDQFKKHTLTNDFISEGVAVADVNKDGHNDILAGMFWFEAPSWTRREIDSGRTFKPETEYSDSFLNFTTDVDGDGWDDLIVIDFPGTSAVWYQNPRNQGGHWKKYLIYDSVGNESPMVADIDNDGKMDLLGGDVTDGGQVVWFKGPSGPEDLAWQRFPISSKGSPGAARFYHGLGFGDVNGDGRSDVIIKDGWFEGPLDPKQPDWPFHPTRISEPCSQMYLLDVNGDGLQDIVSASAHLSGVWWQEQTRDKDGDISFSQHVISYAFAESHAVVLADMNGDGHPDIVTGKRSLIGRNSWKKNPGIHGPPLLYWYEFTPGEEPYWIAHLIDDGSGAGLNLTTSDMNNDGRNDIVISNFKGVFLFENLMEGSSR